MIFLDIHLALVVLRSIPETLFAKSQPTDQVDKNLSAKPSAYIVIRDNCRVYLLAVKGELLFV